MDYTKLFSIVFCFVFLLGFSSAALSVTLSLSSSSIAEGESTTLTANISGSDSGVSASLSGDAILSGDLIVSPAAVAGVSTQAVGTVTTTTSKSWVVQGNSSGTYTLLVTINGATYSTTGTTNLTVNTPANLELITSSCDSDTSLSDNEAYTLNYTIRNTGGTSASVLNTGSYTSTHFSSITAPALSSFTAPSGTIAIDSGETKTVSWTFVADQSTSARTGTISIALDGTSFDETVSCGSYSIPASTTTVTPTEDTTGGGGGDSTTEDSEDSGVDLKAISLSPLTTNINQKTTLSFVFKNIGENTATSAYTAKITVSKNGNEVFDCDKRYTDDLETNDSITFTCDWTPTIKGYHSIYAEVSYPNDDSTSNDFLDKAIKVIDENASALEVTSVVSIGENKTLQRSNNINTFINDLNNILVVLDYPIPEGLSQYIYLPISITRDFNCLDVCNVTLTLKNIGDRNLADVTYYELLPQVSEDNFIKYDIAKFDGNSELIYSYVTDYLDENDRLKSFGVLLETDVLKLTKKKKSISIPPVLYYIIGGILVLVILILLIIKFINYKNTKGYSSRNFSSNTSSNEKSSDGRWSGFGNDNLPRQKYSSGKYKVKEFKSEGPKYKGWK